MREPKEQKSLMISVLLFSTPIQGCFPLEQTDCRGHWQRIWDGLLRDAGPAFRAEQLWSPLPPSALPMQACRSPGTQIWCRQNQCLSSFCLADGNIYIFPLIVFSANTHFLELEHFTSLMGLFSATNEMLKRSMIPKEFNYQVIGQVIRM